MIDENAARLRMNRQPDGMGFYYGVLDVGGGETLRIDILPPRPQHTGLLPKTDCHESSWSLYIDGTLKGYIGGLEDVTVSLLVAIIEEETKA